MKIHNLLVDISAEFTGSMDGVTNPLYEETLGERLEAALDRTDLTSDEEHLRQYWHSRNPLAIWTHTNGIAFDCGDYCQLAYLIWKRSGKNDAAAASMYRRMMENDCPVSDFMFMVAHHVFNS